MKLVSLNILVDLAQEGIIFPFLTSWRGRSGMTTVSLLLHVFRICNDRRENDTKDETIEGLFPCLLSELINHLKLSYSDVNFPLMGWKQTQLTLKQVKPQDSSPSCLDLLGCGKPKVYALIKLMECSKAAILASEHYKTSRELVTTQIDMVNCSLRFFSI